MMRGIIENLCHPERMERLFEEHAVTQYTRTLPFSTVAEVMGEVVFNVNPSVGASLKERVDSLSVETMFQEMTDHLTCEIKTLGYPRAAVFAFCLALMAWNGMSVIQAALRNVHGEETVEETPDFTPSLGCPYWQTQFAIYDLYGEPFRLEVLHVGKSDKVLWTLVTNELDELFSPCMLDSMEFFQDQNVLGRH